MMNNKQEFIETWFQRVWTEENPSAIDEMFHPAGKAEGLGNQPLIGVKQFKEFHSAICALITEINFTVDKCLEEGDWASAFCTLKAKSKKSGALIEISGSVLVRIQGKKIIEGYNQFDFMSLWCQLGYLPIDSFEQGLQGRKIA